MAAQKLQHFSAIETMYRRYKFRSRLEAKWAIFFDQCGWNWSYEPIDLSGWIPDFALGWRPSFVEIKPFFDENEWHEATKKAIDAGTTKDVILLGADPTFFTQDGHAPQIGWWLNNAAESGWIIEPLYFGYTVEANDKFGLSNWQTGWVNLIHELPTLSPKYKIVMPKARSHQKKESAYDAMYRMWAFASNESQWLLS